MELHGAHWREIQRLMVHVALKGEWSLQAKFPDYQRWRSQVDIAGAPIKLVQDLHIKRSLIQANIIGDGWMMAFKVTRVRPHQLPKETVTELGTVLLAPGGGQRGFEGAKVGSLQGQFCFHPPSTLSPDQFRKQFTLLRMFSSEWE